MWKEEIIWQVGLAHKTVKLENIDKHKTLVPESNNDNQNTMQQAMQWIENGAVEDNSGDFCLFKNGGLKTVEENNIRSLRSSSYWFKK